MTDLKPPPVPDVELLRIPRREGRGAPRRRPRFGRWITLALIAAAVWFAWPRVAPILAAWRAPAVMTATVVKTRPGASAELTTASGYVVARTKAAVSSKLSGRLVELRVDVGSRVKKGDILGGIEDDIYRAAHDQAVAEAAQARAEEAAAKARVTIAEQAVAKARAARDDVHAAIEEWKVELAEASRVVNREQDLQKRGAGTPDAVAAAKYKHDLYQANIRRAEAQIKTHEAAIREAEALVEGEKTRVLVATEGTRRADALLAAARSNLADTELRAPFDGVVLRKEADVGEMVVPALMGGGSTRGAVVTLANFDSLEMEVDVFERDLHLIHENGAAQIILDSYQEQPMPGRVRQIEPTADRQKATVLVKVTFDELDPRVLPEMGGRVVFMRPGGESRPAPEILAPPGALVTRDGRRGVYLVEGSRVRFVAVEAGEERKNGTVILKGLSGGELAVVNPDPKIKDGIVVRQQS